MSVEIVQLEPENKFDLPQQSVVTRSCMWLLTHCCLSIILLYFPKEYGGRYTLSLPFVIVKWYTLSLWPKCGFAGDKICEAELQTRLKVSTYWLHKSTSVKFEQQHWGTDIFCCSDTPKLCNRIYQKLSVFFSRNVINLTLCAMVWPLSLVECNEMCFSEDS